MTHQLAPAALVIFGITGDLARRKLLPALYHLAADGLLPEKFEIIGVTRSGTTVESLTQEIRERIRASHESCDEQVLEQLGKSMRILTMDLAEPQEYVRLKQALDDHEARVGACTHRLFYLAVPSQTFGDITQLLGRGGLTVGCPHRVGESRLLIEKPFGYDLQSARELIDALAGQFSEQHIYRVDHYLAKETVQNILAFRFNNPLFQAVWDSDTIQSITVTAAEQIGIEGRIAFYEQTGALRDIIQSHLLQIVALVTMERPERMDAASVHESKIALLSAIKPITSDQIADRAVRGQYEGYHQEVGNHTSITETYAALRLEIDTPRWHKVPVLVRTGKALAEKVTEITLAFTDKHTDHQNTLTFRLQPNEGISIELQAKKPGFDDQTQTVQMDFCYDRPEGGGIHPDAYERVLVDVLKGDKTLFVASDEVLAAWKVVEHVLHAWSMGGADMYTYAVGSWGPTAADQLAQSAGTQWASARLSVCPTHGGRVKPEL